MLTIIQMTSAHSLRSNFLQCWALGLATSKRRANAVDRQAGRCAPPNPPHLERLATAPSRHGTAWSSPWLGFNQIEMVARIAEHAPASQKRVMGELNILSAASVAHAFW
ncbi:hypothetical protein BQ8482_270019 [Mesorhizobium delmotii]|uniref:Uncharacterized protein n=1 Tax=Mesorhizobium delmotii TaxID=1631247 RepID=A0A2P9AMA6_9HYPH|nr:hypothetical protein BQ8482_270019 [Mesorhizobium delmotii]